MHSYLRCGGMWHLGYRTLQDFSASLDLEMKGKNGNRKEVFYFYLWSFQLTALLVGDFYHFKISGGQRLIYFLSKEKKIHSNCDNVVELIFFQGQTAFAWEISGILQHSSRRMTRCLKGRDCYNSTGGHPPGKQKVSSRKTHHYVICHLWSI